MGTDKPTLIFVIEPALLKRIDDFWHAHQFKARSEAIRWLLAAGLDKKLTPKKEK